MRYKHAKHRLTLVVSKYGRRLKLKHLLMATGGCCLLFTLIYTIQFYWPRTVKFSYAQASCFVDPVLLPGLVAKHSSPSFDVRLSKTIAVGRYSLYSHRTCLAAIKPPPAKAIETVRLNKLGNNFIKKSVRVTPGDLPALSSMAIFDKPLAAKGPLSVSLNRADVVFDYRLAANNKKTDCIKQGTSLLCDTAQLELAQATQYQLTLQRLFKKEIAGTVFQKSIKTVEPVRVISSSIASGQTVYNAPSEITLTLDKSVASFSGAKLLLVSGATRQEIPATASLNDKVITMRPKDPLPRSASLELVLDNVVAPDGGYLTAPFVLPFQTSGGPKVVNVNIGSSKVAVTSSIVLTFDSNLDAAQPLSQFVRLDGAAATTITVSGKTVTITPQAALPHCAGLTVKVLDGIKNEFGVAGGSAWHYRTRTICQTIFSIGASVEGRSITGYSFGSGPSKIIFVGTAHGNEKSATYLLNRWVEALEAGAERIPANRTITVIPNLNPDGYAANRRTNAHNVDLNRNFPANDWKSGVSMPEGPYLEQGGGPSPLSEPESQAIANYVQSQNPRLVMNYHANGGIVSPNDAGDSQAIGQTYAQKSPIGYLSNSAGSSFFKYDTTGAFEGYLYDRLGIPALIIELSTKTGNEFYGHQTALWYIAQLP